MNVHFQQSLRINLQFVHSLKDIHQLAANRAQALHLLKSLVNIRPIVANLLLSGIKLQTLLLHKVIHLANSLYVLRSIKTNIFGIPTRFYDSKLLLPEAQSGSRDTQNLRHIADFIEFFIPSTKESLTEEPRC